MSSVSEPRKSSEGVRFKALGSWRCNGWPGRSAPPPDAWACRALEADAFQTTACFWLSIITLGGLGLNAALGWWWMDPLAALGMTVFIGREGMEAWRGEDSCGDGCRR